MIRKCLSRNDGFPPFVPLCGSTPSIHHAIHPSHSFYLTDKIKNKNTSIPRQINSRIIILVHNLKTLFKLFFLKICLVLVLKIKFKISFHTSQNQIHFTFSLIKFLKYHNFKSKNRN